MFIEQIGNILTKCNRSRRYRASSGRLILSYVYTHISCKLGKILPDKRKETEQTVLLTNLEVFNLVKLHQLTTVYLAEAF